MKKTVVFAAALIVSGLFAGSSFADTSPNGAPPCSYDSTAKAKALKTPMIRAFAACGGSTTYPAPNSFLGATNTDACAPSVPLSSFLYGPKGACSLKIGSKEFSAQPVGGGSANKCFPDDSQNACNVTTLKAICKDVREADGVTLLDEDQSQPEGAWKLNTFTRGTLDDRVNGGAHTAIDFPVTFKFPPAKKGKLIGKFNANSALFDLLGFGSALPQCSNLELLSIVVSDSNSSPFAAIGVGSGGGN